MRTGERKIALKLIYFRGMILCFSSLYFVHFFHSVHFHLGFFLFSGSFYTSFVFFAGSRVLFVVFVLHSDSINGRCAAILLLSLSTFYRGRSCFAYFINGMHKMNKHQLGVFFALSFGTHFCHYTMQHGYIVWTTRGEAT